MSAEFTVTRAFQGMQEDKVTPEVINTKAGPCHKVIFQLEGHKEWFNMLRKIDENGQSQELKVGDKVYGDVALNNYGKKQFTRAQRPQDGSQPARPLPQQPSGSLEDKIDYLTGLVENFLNDQKGAYETTKKQADVSPTDIDDGPVDLSQIDY